MLCNANPGV
ncbi:hypothetical protein LINPERPRIM_LOCUS1476 [Linum perenne]